MNASKLHPNMWKGEEINGGTFGKNQSPASAASPPYNGKLYLKGIGWFFLSGWDRKGRFGPFIALRAQEMSDEQVEKLVPKDRSKHGPQDSVAAHGNGAEESGSGIPF